MEHAYDACSGSNTHLNIFVIYGQNIEIFWGGSKKIPSYHPLLSNFSKKKVEMPVEMFIYLEFNDKKFQDFELGQNKGEVY